MGGNHQACEDDGRFLKAEEKERCKPTSSAGAQASMGRKRNGLARHERVVGFELIETLQGGYLVFDAEELQNSTEQDATSKGARRDSSLSCIQAKTSAFQATASFETTTNSNDRIREHPTTEVDYNKATCTTKTSGRRGR